MRRATSPSPNAASTYEKTCVGRSGAAVNPSVKSDEPER